MPPKTDYSGSRQRSADKNSDREGRRKAIDAVLGGKGLACERARAIASLRRAKEIKQFLMSLFLSHLHVRNGALLVDIKVAVSLL